MGKVSTSKTIELVKEVCKDRSTIAMYSTFRFKVKRLALLQKGELQARFVLRRICDAMFI